ncbi:molecular chaperone GrpE [Halopenitus malekzadehii]|uniref:Protein GrpE n=1 Tax=Halopenitus malekzadehii TaxID=1267564 RepID=A0A1H6JKV5_9EURY|nr:nucleotide exchange factor GrpE [Halopenitus malekzadehii]SEH59801.1 molecular chaperone GrpE [Halopenitus malekzadehii]
MSEDDAEAIEFEDHPDVETKASTDADADDVDADGSDTTTGDVDDGGEPTLADRVADLDDEDAAAIAEAVADLEARVEELEAETDEQAAEIKDLTDRLKRKQADFQNYKQRAKRKQESIKERAAEDLIERILPVRDNLQRALEQEEGADIRPGVESTLEEFDRVLADEDVEPIEPEPGTDVDPTRHQVMLRVDSDQPAGTIAEVFQPGYELGESVIREAQVTVSEE